MVEIISPRDFGLLKNTLLHRKRCPTNGGRVRKAKETNTDIDATGRMLISGAVSVERVPTGIRARTN